MNSVKSFFYYLIYFYTEWNKSVATKHSDRTGNEGSFIGMWWGVHLLTLLLFLGNVLELLLAETFREITYLKEWIHGTLPYSIIAFVFIAGYTGDIFKKRYDKDLTLQRKFENFTVEEHRVREKQIWIYSIVTAALFFGTLFISM